MKIRKKIAIQLFGVKLIKKEFSGFKKLLTKYIYFIKILNNFVLSVLSLFTVTIIVLSSCSEDTINNNSFESMNKREPEPIKFHIWNADWDSFGRTSKNCDGIGLCYFTICWFCCTQNDVVVPCPEAQSSTPTSGGYGMIRIDKATNQGHLIIKLNPEKQIEQEAITGKEIFYIDEDIVNEEVGVVLLKGEYEFNERIGVYGGYLVDAVLLD